ncbi:cupin domain-containing protein [Gemmatimonas sp.]|uniref:cupin domain-containing protein n=1 Tax=Gemmatimonas sp. TaxID=1962908 RepID=UPI003340A358
MEPSLRSSFPYDTVLTFGAAMAFCGWMLWDLRKENKLAAAKKAALQRARASAPPPTASASAMRWPTPAASGPVVEVPTLPASLYLAEDMTDVRKIAWDDMAVEELTPLIGRRLVYTDKQMLAHVYLKQGAIVPAHDHINEQITYILSGALRFWIGEHADQPGETFVDVRAGEVLVIPSMVRHRAEALEDTLDVDIFNPPRQDWIDKSDDYLRSGKPMSNGGQG